MSAPRSTRSVGRLRRPHSYIPFRPMAWRARRESGHSLRESARPIHANSSVPDRPRPVIRLHVVLRPVALVPQPPVVVKNDQGDEEDPEERSFHRMARAVRNPPDARQGPFMAVLAEGDIGPIVYRFSLPTSRYPRSHELLGSFTTPARVSGIRPVLQHGFNVQTTPSLPTFTLPFPPLKRREG